MDEIVRPTRVEVDLNQLTENFCLIKKYTAPSKVMAVLKANAYGNGLIRIAQLMQELKADYLGVAVLEEGILLRQSGITLPILVMGGILGNQIPVFLKYNFTITASSIDKLNQINEAAAAMKVKANVHLKIDTGMERIGVHFYNAEKFLKVSITCKNIFVEGIYSHFASADSDDLTFAKLQLQRFHDVLGFYDKHSLETPVKHISNSGAILQMPEANLDLVRPGILLFGVYPSSVVKKTIPVRPTLSWKSHVVYFKAIKPGHPVSYNSTFTPDHLIRAVTVPVGYGDGYFRSMSHKAEVLIRGKRYLVIGSITMDQIVVNIGNDSAFNGDEVILIGSEGKNSVTCEELANWAGTIPYEILTNINTRVPRIYKD